HPGPNADSDLPSRHRHPGPDADAVVFHYSAAGGYGSLDRSCDAAGDRGRDGSPERHADPHRDAGGDGDTHPMIATVLVTIAGTVVVLQVAAFVVGFVVYLDERLSR